MILFICGFIVGIVSTFLILLYWGNRRYSKTLNALNETSEAFLKKTELVGSAKLRFNKIEDITADQLSLIKQLDMPSSSASHSRYKNTLIRQLSDMENEKIEIMRSIVKDGIDPVVSFSIDGEIQKMKMSEAVTRHDAKSNVTKTDSKIPHKKNKLQLVTNNEDKPNEQSNNPKIP